MKKMKALIFGVSGQDGSYLSQLLLKKNYEVHGVTREISDLSYKNLQTLSIENHISLEEFNPLEYKKVFDLINYIKPNEIYNLSGQSSVGLSFSRPLETLESINTISLNILESIRKINQDIKFYNASSGEVFGERSSKPADENSTYFPVSPYGLAKSQSAIVTKLYREIYNIHACSGYLFNHESPLRPSTYVTQKIISGACNISKDKNIKLKLGNIDISRDWGYAPEYVNAMWKMLQLDEAEDFIIATGRTISLKDFIKISFGYFNLDWKEHVEIDKSLFRPSDIKINKACPKKALIKLGWSAEITVEELISKMISAKNGIY